MARLKFLVFALLVLAVWATHLVLLTPPLASGAVELAKAQAQGSRPLAEVRIAERRQLLLRALAGLSAQRKLGATVQAVRGQVTPEKLRVLRNLAEEQADGAIKDDLIVGFVTDDGGVFFRGKDPAQGLDPALGQAGLDGMLQEAFDVGHLFVSFPVWDRGAGEPRTLGSVVLGMPLLTEGMMDDVAHEASLAAVGIFQGGRLVQGGGSEKAALERAAKVAKLDSGTVVESGDVGSLGPIKVPFFVDARDWTGGRAPLLVASRRAIEDTPYELIALASVRPLMSALGAYQRFALAAFGGLFLLTLVWMILMGGGEASSSVEEVEAEPAPEPAWKEAEPSGAQEPYLAAPMPGAAEQDEQGEPRSEAAIARMTPQQIEDELQRDDDSAPMAMATPMPMRQPEPEREQEPEPTPSLPREPPYEDAAPPEPPPEPITSAESDLVPSSARPFEMLPSQEPFAPYQAPAESDPDGTRPRQVPFALPGDEVAAGYPYAQQPLEDSGPQDMPRFSSDPSVPVGPQDENPDATRVAIVSQELLAASARSTTPSMASFRPSGPVSLPKMPAVAAAVPSREEQHFQEIYREFVATRERCGEGADGLTYDKFAQKLRKNKEQLMQKYGCKTVRFQVYVKEGKAALKATPIKE